MTDEITKDPFEEERNHKASLSREAKELLANPMLQGFIEHRKEECVQAFFNLPFGGKLEEYQTVQHDFHSIERLKVALEKFVADYDLMELSDRKIDVEGI